MGTTTIKVTLLMTPPLTKVLSSTGPLKEPHILLMIEILHSLKDTKL